jgi:hypothetical protein
MQPCVDDLVDGVHVRRDEFTYGVDRHGSGLLWMSAAAGGDAETTV